MDYTILFFEDVFVVVQSCHRFSRKGYLSRKGQQSLSDRIPLRGLAVKARRGVERGSNFVQDPYLL